MKIYRRSLLCGAEEAKGSVVVIDVLRAFTCASLMFSYGIEKLVLVSTPEEAFQMRQLDPKCLLAGEVNGEKVEGFDVGNSPADVVRMGAKYFEGRTVVQRSSAGTQGATVAAGVAEEIILGSYTTASAVAAYLKRKDSETLSVTLLAMGVQAREACVEDERCADYIEHLLTGKPYDHIEGIRECLSDPSIAAGLRGEKPHMPKEDIVWALQRDLFDFVLVGRLVGKTAIVQRNAR